MIRTYIPVEGINRDEAKFDNITDVSVVTSREETDRMTVIIRLKTGEKLAVVVEQWPYGD